MSECKISELQSKCAIAKITSFFFTDNWNDVSCLVTSTNNFLQQLNIKKKITHNLQFEQLPASKILPMDSPEIRDEHDYQTCIRDGRKIEYSDKSLFCLNFYYVFYAEIEINLNRYFTRDSREQWSLLFVDYNFMPPVNINTTTFDTYTTAQIFWYEPHIVTILHNAKIKYCCLHCDHEWTTARGRAIFQAEIPERNKYNVLFAYLFTQKCQRCHQDTEPSWYVDEATRVMKNVCRILIDKFYSNRQFFPTPSSSSSSEEEKEEFVQRSSTMRNPHPRDLCRACQEGSCYVSHRPYQQNR